MAFLPSLRQLAATWKLPFILVASPPLREVSSLFASTGSSELSPSLIEPQVRSPVPPVLHRSQDGRGVTSSKQKELKKRGFNAIIRWCAYHQEVQRSNDAHFYGRSVECEEEARLMDATVAHWVNASQQSFSCGQNLVVLTFLCDVLQRQKHKEEDSKSPSSSSTHSDLTVRLTQTIAQLITNAVTSEQLELQPFLILLSAIYGLVRITDENPLQLKSVVLESILPPSALWLALLHQLRAFYSVAGDAEESLDASVNIEALLTVFFLFDERRCSMFFVPNDYRMMDRLAHRLVRLIQPALEASRAARQRQGKKSGEEKVVRKASADAVLLTEEAEEHGTNHNEEEKAITRIFHSEGDVNVLPMRNRISMRDCCFILSRIRASAAACRLDLLEYFLCVMHDPTLLTQTEIQALPDLFFAPYMPWPVRRTGLADYVARVRGISELETLAPLLGFMQDMTPYVTFVDKQLREVAARSGTMDEDLAGCLLLTAGRHLSWDSRAQLVLNNLAKTPVVLHAVEAALESSRRRCSRDSGAEPVEANAVAAQAKVLLSPSLCVLLRYLFLSELKMIPFPLSPNLDREKYTAYTEALTIAGAMVRSIHWAKCAPDQLVQPRVKHYPGNQLSPFCLAFGVLTAYLESHDTYHFLTTEDEIEDRALLNTFVLPLLRNSKRSSHVPVLRVLRQTLPHLKSVEYQRQLVNRAFQYGSVTNFRNFFFFVHDFMVVATELRVFPAELIDFIFRQHTLVPRALPSFVEANMNFSKAYTTVLVRVVRYVLAAGVLTTKNGSAEAAERRATLEMWFCHYFATVSSGSRRSDLCEKRTKFDEVGRVSLEGGEIVIGDMARDIPVVVQGISDTGKAVQSGAEEPHGEDDEDHHGGIEEGHQSPRSNNNRTKEETERDRDEMEEEEVAASDGASIAEAHLLDEAFTSSVTEDDFEVMLTLMLQTGCRASARALAFIAQRLRDKAFIANSTHALPVLQEENALSTGDCAATLSWLGESNVVMREHEWLSEASKIPLHLLPLPAHFVFAVRADSALAIPLTAPYLITLLNTCDLSIFHHVFSAFFLALKRRRTTVMLVHDMKIAETSMDILQKRLVACRKEHESKAQNDEADAETELLSAIAFKSLVQLLFHFSQLPPRTPQLRNFLESLVGSTGTADRNLKTTTFAGDNVTESNSEMASDGDEEEDDDDDVMQLLRSAHAKAASSVLQVAAFITPSQLKEFTLAHLQRLALFFADAAAFVFLQVRPQLSGFTQRELFQVAAQYPPGEADVLAELSKLDMHASIDLGDFVPTIKSLPMRINEAVILAHTPYLTIALVTRVLSALAARHEEMPVSLLRTLLTRVEAVADTATESDKGLLLLILQGYLLFGTTSTNWSTKKFGASADDMQGRFFHRRGRTGQKLDEQTCMEDLLSSLAAKRNRTAPLTPEEQQHRIDLVRHCCDFLLSLERISTLEDLRYFLVSYPPSLHQLRERGVISMVEHKLLPAMLTASPVRWAELDTLVHLLSEHRVLLPRTVHQIADVLFAPLQVVQLQRASLASVESDSAAVLTGCLSIAVVCAEAVRGTHTSEYPHGAFPLLHTVDKLLRVFGVTQDWLAALTTFMSPQVKVGSYNSAASSANASPFPSMSPVPLFFSPSLVAVARHLCTLLLRDAGNLRPSEFTRLVQSVGRLKAWDLAMPQTSEQLVHRSGTEGAVPASTEAAVDFPRVFCAMFERADPHSRCALVRAIASNAHVFHCFETFVLRVLQNDIALLSSEDVETVLTVALQVSDEAMVEPLLDAVGTRLLPMMDQCRRSTLVRLLQCHTAFRIDDKAVILTALGALDRQSAVEVKLDAVQVIVVLEAIAKLPVSETPERLIVLCFQRLEKLMQALSPIQLYQVGRLILDLEMGYIPCIHTLVTCILESRDGPRSHRDFHNMAETLCDVFDVEVDAQLRMARLRKRRQKERIRDFYANQRKLLQEA